MSDSDAGLRARLVDVGARLLATEGPQALTLREIARRAGVSYGAPRRYFPTHRDLLSAIARRGATPTWPSGCARRWGGRPAAPAPG